MLIALVHACVRMNGAGPFIHDPLDSVSAAAALGAASEAGVDLAHAGLLGRTLTPKDFPRNHPFNSLPGTERFTCSSRRHQLSLTRNTRNQRDSLGSPLVSQFLAASQAAPSSQIASVNPLSPANGTVGALALMSMERTPLGHTSNSGSAMWFLFQIAIMTLESLGAQGRRLCRGVSRRFRGQLIISQTRRIAATAIKLTSANQKKPG